jgi:hypothetical protein
MDISQSRTVDCFDFASANPCWRPCTNPEWRRRGDDRALLESRLGEILPLIFGQQA